MDANGWTQIALALLVVTALTRPLGRYLHIVMDREHRPFPALLVPLERAVLALLGSKGEEQSWQAYLASVLAFGVACIAVGMLLLMAQGMLPWNPAGVEGFTLHRAFNTAVSFVTNTNWQSYPGAEAVSPLIQAVFFTWQNFVSAATSLAVAIAVTRGLTRRGLGSGIGNFWLDLVRGTLFVLLPGAALAAVLLAALGVPQTLDPAVTVATLDGGQQTITLGLVASQEAIKMLGTNGGGFFNANTAHPFSGPNGLAVWLSVVLMLLLPSALTNTYGRMAKDQRQGWALFAAVMALLLTSLLAIPSELGPTAALQQAGLVDAGNPEGKEVRVGTALSVFYGLVTTATSSGAVVAMHDSFGVATGLVVLVNMLLGEVVFGGVGVGLYGMLSMAILTVFLAGLMIGRTPELLGRKIESREVTLVVLVLLVPSALILIGTALGLSLPFAARSIQDPGPHGLSEMLYAYTSASLNNGSAFAGFHADTAWHNTALGVAMLIGRYLGIVAMLAIAGSMITKRAIPSGPGTFPTSGPLFVWLLLGVILIVSALTYIPALALGPFLELAMANAGRLF